jgi:hypothetical protein
MTTSTVSADSNIEVDQKPQSLNDVRKIYWTELLYNPYRKGVFPELLRQPIVEKTFYSRCKGMSKFEPEVKLCIEYDEQYLVEYFIKKIFLPLHIGVDTNDFNLLLKFLGKAYKQHKEALKNEMV